MSQISNLLLPIAMILIGATTLLWGLSLRLRNVSIVDIFWGLGFVLVSGTSFFRAGAHSSRSFLVLILSTIWGLRLALYLLIRNWGQPEDYRYQNMRNQVGKKFKWLSFFTVFLLQGFLIFIISLPLQVSVASKVTLNAWDFIGTLSFFLGLFFEAVGDWQLSRFKKNPQNQGKVLDQGLWKYTRHPNYFGDFLVWWGFYFIALAAGGGWTLFSPAIMSFLLLKVSGVSLLEKNLKNRTQGYQDYISKTSPFFPWKPKQKP